MSSLSQTPVPPTTDTTALDPAQAPLPTTTSRIGLGLQALVGNQTALELLGLQASNPTDAVDLLTDHGLFDNVTPEEAGKAMEVILTRMDPATQRAVLTNMDDDAFEALLEQTPLEQRPTLARLMYSTDDPERLMQLYGASANARAEIHHNTGGGRTGDPAVDAHRQAISDATYASSTEEIATDMAIYQGALDDGNFDRSSFLEVAQNRVTEQDIEATHGVNLTRATDADGRPQAIWSDAELGEVKTTLDHMDPAQTADNTGLTEFRRVAEAEVGSAGGRGGDGVVEISNDDTKALWNGARTSEATRVVREGAAQAQAAAQPGLTKGKAAADPIERYGRLTAQATMDPDGLRYDLLDGPAEAVARAEADYQAALARVEQARQAQRPDWDIAAYETDLAVAAGKRDFALAVQQENFGWWCLVGPEDACEAPN